MMGDWLITVALLVPLYVMAATMSFMAIKGYVHLGVEMNPGAAMNGPAVDKCDPSYHLKPTDMTLEDWRYWPNGLAEEPILKHKYFGCELPPGVILLPSEMPLSERNFIH